MIFGVLLAVPVNAQVPDSSRDEEARRLFQAGQIAYEDARYADALGYFERSYELSQRPELLFNIGQTADRLRDDERAIAAFERYVELLPDAENRRQVEVRLDILRTRSTPVADPPAPSAEEPRSELAQPPEEPRPRRWWIGVVVAVAVVAAGAGIAIALTRDAGTQEPLAGDVGPGGVVFTLRSGR